MSATATIVVVGGCGRRPPVVAAGLAAQPDAEVVAVPLHPAGQRESLHPGGADGGGAGGWATAVIGHHHLPLGTRLGLAVLGARGRWLVLADAAVEAEPATLAALVREAGRPGTGAAAPLLLSPDGRVAAAGWLLGGDGLLVPYGRGVRPDDWSVRFPRTVDAAPPALLVLARASLEAAGGFDPDLDALADLVTDLALGLAERGGRTRFVPHARAVVPDATESLAGEVPLAGAVRRRWAALLGDRPPLGDREERIDAVVAARDAGCTDRVLVVDERVPHHDRGAGDTRADLILRTIALLWPDARVTLFVTAHDGLDRYGPELAALGIEIAPAPGSWLHWFEARRFQASVVVVSRPHTYEGVRPLLRYSQPQAALVYDTEALFFRRWERTAATSTDPAERADLRAEAARVRALEVEALARADAVLAVSDEEARFAEGLAGEGRVRVVPYAGAPHPDPPGFATRDGVIFFGGFLAGPRSPNEDALLWLVDRVLPRLWVLLPDVRLRVVGADPTPAVRALHGTRGGRVEVVGYVDDPAPWLHAARVHANPPRYGSGVKNKLLDTMAVGLPLVTTPVGAEGLHLGTLERWLVSEDPSELAHLLHRLYTVEDRWRAVQRRLLELCGQHFSAASFRRGIADALCGVGAAAPDAPTRWAAAGPGSRPGTDTPGGSVPAGGQSVR